MALSDQFTKLKEQEWYQQLQTAYQQLTPDQQTYFKWGSMLGGFSLLFYFAFSIFDSANSVKNEYFQKQELSQMITNANDEIRRLKGQNAGFSQASPQTWKAALQGIASQQGVNAESIEITKEAPGVSENVIQETLLQAKIKGVALRPLVQMLYQMEHGSPPLKLKGMSIDTNASDGTLDVLLNLSGYMAKAEKESKSK